MIVCYLFHVFAFNNNVLLNLKGMKLFSDTLHRDQWQRYLRRYPIHVYKKNEIILMQGVVPSCVRIIKSGLVKTYNINNHGEERPVSYDASGEIFPAGWIYEAIGKTRFFYEAFSDCEIFEIPKKDFLFYLRLHPKVGYEMFVALAKRNTTMQSRIYALQQSKASEKIIRTFLYLCERFGVPVRQNSDEVRLTVPLTQQELANFMGITRETTSHELHKLELQKLITKHRKMYKVNVVKLKAFLHD